jgi:RAB protein geranylgeranyltransferase component A
LDEETVRALLIHPNQVLNVTDIYIAVVSSAHSVCPKGYYIAIVSTIAETSANHHLELAPGIERLGKIEEKFMVGLIYKLAKVLVLTQLGSTNPTLRAPREWCE